MQIKEARPKVTLVARMAASVANYDYIVDWEFQTDGLIRIKVILFSYCYFFCCNINLINQGLISTMHAPHLSLS